MSEKIIKFLNRPEKHQTLLNDLYLFLKTIPTGFQQYRISDNHIYNKMTVIKQFLYFIDLDTSKVIFDIRTDNVFNFLEKTQSKNTYYQHLRHFFRYCYHNGLLEKDRYEILNSLKFQKKNSVSFNQRNQKKWSIPYNMWEKLLEEIHSPFLRMAIWLGLNFGLRVGEIINLTLLDIELDKCYIYITPANKPISWFPKTRNSIRKIPITKKQNKILKDFLSQRREKNFPYLLYFIKHNRPLQLNYFWLFKRISFIKINFGYKVKTLRPHVLRYSFATHLYFNSGTKNPLILVSKLLGHSSVDTTCDYLNLDDIEFKFKYLKLMNEGDL
jgi:integrase